MHKEYEKELYKACLIDTWVKYEKIYLMIRKVCSTKVRKVLILSHQFFYVYGKLVVWRHVYFKSYIISDLPWCYRASIRRYWWYLDTICILSCWKTPRWDDRNPGKSSNVHRQKCDHVSKLISFDAFGVSSVDGIVRNFNSQKVAVIQACCQRVVLLAVKIDCAEKYQMHNWVNNVLKDI